MRFWFLGTILPTWVNDLLIFRLFGVITNKGGSKGALISNL